MHPVLFLAVLAVSQQNAAPQNAAQAPRTAMVSIAHRGLWRDAPENTLPAYAACLELRIGFEIDVRRTSDGQLVSLHDDDLKRTTGGAGKVGEVTLEQLRARDAGNWFHPSFAGEKVPTIDEIFALAKSRGRSEPIAIDLKTPGVEAEVVKLALKHGVRDRLVFIGLALRDEKIRQAILTADPKSQVARAVESAEQLGGVADDRTCTWIYMKFVPTEEQVQALHRAGKRVIVSRSNLPDAEPEVWGQLHAAGADAVITDFPLECRRAGKASAK